MQRQLDRVEEKIDKIDTKVTNIAVTTALQQQLIERNTADLEDHMARTEANEELIEKARDELNEHRLYIKAFHKYTLFIITALGGVATFGRMLGWY